MIDKYKGADDSYLFPRRSNKTLNAYLKEIQELCGIEKKLHTHLARHTFATTICLLNGISAEATAKMMGITLSRLVSTYGKIVDRRIANET